MRRQNLTTLCKRICCYDIKSYHTMQILNIVPNIYMDELDYFFYFLPTRNNYKYLICDIYSFMGAHFIQ